MQTVIIADSQEMFRAGVIDLLSRHQEFHLVAQVPDWQVLLLAMAMNPGCIVITSASLVGDFDVLIATAQESNCRLLLVMEDSDSPRRYRSMGVAGLIHRSTAAYALVDTLRRIETGAEKLVIPAGARLVEDCLGVQVADRLNLREMSIVALLMRGFKNRRIAEHLGLPEHAVRATIQKIFDKTGQSSRLELALFVSEHRAFASAASDTYAKLERLWQAGEPAAGS